MRAILFRMRRQRAVVPLLFTVSALLVAAPLALAEAPARYLAAAEAPISEPIELEEGLTPDFCSQWNPEFEHQGFICCPDPSKMRVRSRRGRLRRQCDPRRNRQSYCSEMTEEQRKLLENPDLMRIDELLTRLENRQNATEEPQALCGPNNGFLAFGKPLVETPENRVKIRSPNRCTNFGTDSMVAMLNWLGRKVGETFRGEEYARTHLVVGDIAAPRGGCLAGSGGRKGHASHTNGLDADIAFLVAKPKRESPVSLHKQFDPQSNWWLLKQMLQNPFACVKRVFLDRRLISKLAKVASSDPLWTVARKIVQHQKHHGNHFHVRLGERPGAPGCNGADPFDPELELEDEIGTQTASAQR